MSDLEDVITSLGVETTEKFDGHEVTLLALIEDVEPKIEALQSSKHDISTALDGDYNILNNVSSFIQITTSKNAINTNADSISALTSKIDLRQDLLTQFNGDFNSLENVPSLTQITTNKNVIKTNTGSISALTTEVNLKQDLATAFDGDYNSFEKIPSLIQITTNKNTIN